MATAETARLVAELSLRDNMSKGMRSANASLSKLEKTFGRTQTSLGKFGHNLERGLVLGAAAAAGGFIAVAKAAGDFEAQLNTINTIARANASDLGKIGDAIRKVARDSGTPLDDLTQAYYDLLSAGIKTADATNVLTQANTLAIGGLSTTAEAIDLLTTTINTYGGDATKAAEYTDVFAKAIERGKVTAAELAESFSQVGPIAAASGISVQELGASYARLTAAGVPAAEASTNIRSAIVALTRTTPALEKLQKATHKNYLSIAGKQGLVEALQQMRTDAKKSGVPLIDLLGRVEGLNFTLLTTGPNFAAYNADLAAMGDASGTAAAQMAERQQGLNFQLARLKALAKDAGITIGSALLPKLTPLVSKLNDFISANQSKIADFGTTLADAFEKVATAVGKVDWQPFIDGLKFSAEIAGAAIAAFRSMPADLQKIVIGGLAINKVTGGLVTSLAKDIGGGVFKLVFERGSSPANPLFVSAIGGVGGVGGVGAAGAAGKGSALSKIGGAAMKVFMVGAAVGVFAELLNVRNEQSTANKEQQVGLTAQNSVYVKSASIDDMKGSLAGIEALQTKLNSEISGEGFAFQANIDGVRDSVERQAQTLRDEIGKSTALQNQVTHAGDYGIQQGVAAAKAATDRVVTADQAVRAAVAAAASKTAAAEFQTQQAIHNKDLSVTTNVSVPVSVSIRDVANAQATRASIYRTHHEEHQ